MSDWREKLKKRAMASALANQKNGGDPWFKEFPLKPYEMKTGGDKNLIDIIPWKVTQKWYKKLQNKQMQSVGLEIGDWDYKIEYAVHRDFGPKQMDKDLCLNYMFGEPCPICEEIAEAKNGGAQYDDYKDIAPKWRTIYCVLDTKNRKDGCKILDITYHWIEKTMLKRMIEDEKDGEILIPYDIKDGLTLQFRGTKETFGGGKGKKEVEFIKPEGLELVQRERQYTEKEALKLSISLDSYLIIPTYESVKAKMRGASSIPSKEVEKKKSVECPYDYKFGDDWREQKLCRKCERKEEKIFQACQQAYQESIE